eukprot:561764-Rhodomonas_salina.1
MPSPRSRMRFSVLCGTELAYGAMVTARGTELAYGVRPAHAFLSRFRKSRSGMCGTEGAYGATRAAAEGGMRKRLRHRGCQG